MRIRTLLSLLLCLVVGSGFALAADCMNGRGTLQRPLWDGFALQIGPAQGDQVNECRAAIVGADGKAIFETVGVDAEVLRATGRDVNGDEKLDVVLLTHGSNSPANVYSVVGTDPPGLIRQIVTSADLDFEERMPGHIDIVTRDTAFQDFEGLSGDQVPAPMIFLRLKGKEIYNVSQIYWPDYEREIELTKANMSKDDLARFKGEFTTQDRNEKEGKYSPAQLAQLRVVRSQILKIVLNDIYGGHGAEAWQALKEMWPYNDRDRIRAAILQRRMTGVLRDISRPADHQANAQ